MSQGVRSAAGCAWRWLPALPAPRATSLAHDPPAIGSPVGLMFPLAALWKNPPFTVSGGNDDSSLLRSLGGKCWCRTMATFGYIRTGREDQPGRSGSDPEVQRRQIVDAGVEQGRIYGDVAISGGEEANSRAQWELLDGQLSQGDVLVVSAIDRLGHGSLETMRAIHDLHRRGVRLRSLATDEGEWTRFLDAVPDSPEAIVGTMLARPEQSRG